MRKYYIIESGGENSQRFQVVKHDIIGREIIKGDDDMLETTEDALRALLMHLGISFEEMLSDDYLTELLEDLAKEKENE